MERLHPPIRTQAVQASSADRNGREVRQKTGDCPSLQTNSAYECGQKLEAHYPCRSLVHSQKLDAYDDKSEYKALTAHRVSYLAPTGRIRPAVWAGPASIL